MCISRQRIEDIAQVMTRFLNLDVLVIAEGEPVIGWSTEELRLKAEQERQAEEATQAQEGDVNDNGDEDAETDIDDPDDDSLEAFVRQLNSPPEEWPLRRTLVRLFHGALRPGGKLLILNDMFSWGPRPNPVVRRFSYDPISAVYALHGERLREGWFRSQHRAEFWAN
jgi:hypothetical protein